MARNDQMRLRCSFCGKTQDQVDKLISGMNDTFICDECVELCMELVNDDLELKAAQRRQRAQKNAKPLPKPQEIKATLDEYVIGKLYSCQSPAILHKRKLQHHVLSHNYM